MSRNEAFEAGKAQRAAGIASGRIYKYDTPLREKHATADGKGTYDTSIMLGGEPSGATSAIINDLTGEARMYKGKQNIGALTYTSKAIHHVQTHSDFRRKGVATKLLRLVDFARGMNGEDAPLKHAETRTQAGDAWSKAVGGELPPKIPAAGITQSALEDLK